jgi:hypothetical protein
MIKQFYEKTLPSQGVYCVAGIKNKRTTQRFAETLDEVVTLAENFKKQGTDVYVAMASFEGYSRKAEDAQFLRSFFIDLDVGEDKAAAKKGYLTKEEAHDNLLTWLEKKELPPPIILDSGTGIHAYWAFEEDVAVDEWKLYAEKFKAFCLQDLYIDPAPTADVARIMRCPDTFNYKTQPPSEASIISDCEGIYSFEAFKEFLGVEEPTSESILKHLPKGLDEDTKAILKLDNVETIFDKIATRSMEGDGCEQIKWAIENRENLPEPIWVATLSIAQHCTDRDSAIHAISQDYPKYSWQETENKATQRQGKPFSCDKFNENNPGICDTCKYKGQFTNPLALGRSIKVAKAEPVREDEDTEVPAKSLIPDHPDYLFPYFRGEQGGIYFQPPHKIDKKGNKTQEDPFLIYEHDLFPIARMFSKVEGSLLQMRVLLPKDEIRDFTLATKIIQSTDKLKEALLFHDVIPLPRNMPHLMEYVNKWGKYLASTVQAEIVQMQMGWTEAKEGKRLGSEFVIGNQMVKSDGTVHKTPVAPIIRSIAKMFNPKGTFEKWQECVQELNTPSMELHALGTLTGFGAPIMNLTSTSGVTLSYTGESGNGKTGALMANLSIWGNPKDMWVLEATNNGLVTRYVTFKNIPYGVDEAHQKSPEELAKLVHAVSQGKAKIRMMGSVNAEREHELVASSIAMMASNRPLLDIIMEKKAYANGEMARMIEIVVNRPQALAADPGFGRRVFDPLKYNYGHAGVKIMQGYYALGENDLLERIAYWLKRIQHDFGTDDIYRFYLDYVCATFTAGMVANEFKIIDYDLERIYRRLVTEMIYLRDNVVKLGQMDYEGLVGDFINKYYTGFLGINDGKVSYEPRTSLVGRMDVAAGQVLVSTTEFKKYLSEKQVSSREFEIAMKAKGILIETKKTRLDAGWKNAFSMLDKNMNVNAYVFATQIPSEFFDATGDDSGA